MCFDGAWPVTYQPPTTRVEIEELIAEVYEDHPGLIDALKVKHKIVEDIKDRLVRYGSISDKQVALVFKLQRDEAQRAQEAETNIPVPNCRRPVRGRVVSTKLQWSDYTQGEVLKMLVLVTEEDGSTFRVFGSVPRSVLDEIHDRGEAERKYWFSGGNAVNTQTEPPPNPNLKGATIMFTARLKQSLKDESFGFFSRPSRASVVSWE